MQFGLWRAAAFVSSPIHLLYFPAHFKHVTTLPCESSTADIPVFDFQQVTDGVCGRVQVGENENGPDIRRSWGED